MVDFAAIFAPNLTEVNIGTGIFTRSEAQKAPESVPSRSCEELGDRFIVFLPIFESNLTCVFYFCELKNNIIK